jgi:hypothetical protein
MVFRVRTDPGANQKSTLSETMLESHHLRRGAASCQYVATAKDPFPSHFGIAFFVKVSPRKVIRVTRGMLTSIILHYQIISSYATHAIWAVSLN